MSGSTTIFYGGLVTPIDPLAWKALPRCLLAVGPIGNIDWLLERVNEDELENVLNEKGYNIAEVVKLKKGEFIIPGFVDTHTHAPQFPNLGCGGQYELLDWLNNVTFPREAQFADLDFAKEAYTDVVRRTLNYGTTTCCYYGTIHADATKVLADVVNKAGQRAFIGKCNMNREGESPPYYIEKDVETSIADTQSVINHIQSLLPVSSHAGIGTSPEPLVQPIITPRFAISCTSEMLDALSKLVEDNERKGPNEPRLRIQTHISENESEIKHTLKLFPDESYYAQIYDVHGLLRDTTILAHACHLTNFEIDLIKERNSGISHCPTSNFNLRSGVAPIGKYLDEGIKVGLGTDVSGGYSVSMLNAIRDAAVASKVISMKPSDSCSPLPPFPTSTHKFSNRQLPIQTLFYLATLGGADVCGLRERIGSLSSGKSFDALIVSTLDNMGAMGLWGKEADVGDGLKEEKKKLEENLERFMFCGDDRNISKVYVQGRLVGGQTEQ